MNDTMITVVGRVATTPVFRELPSGPVTRFRIAVTPRHFDRARNEWADGHTNFFTVWARRALGLNAQSSLSVGEQVIVQGRLKIKDEERGGQHWLSVDIDAHAIGHDLARGTSAFRRGKVQTQAPMEREPAWESPVEGVDPGAESASGAAADATATVRAEPGATAEARPEPAAVG
ncbi:single-stranded DNA-binding protein [Streptomyces sp. AN091965]|uniref:single-stranded DNA-binding protein n=1 Tax=Streptomyces sp. AN091965 TaxID=2927803 RepID=UPI001F61CEE3|nr:single-stranded DNA-binding protein [Streptomyces sp. AN091965]MCI3930771.1 single-stranded DNA-binding protein [Streptomyces sp. AN091965]